jgi:hypothetical protein
MEKSTKETADLYLKDLLKSSIISTIVLLAEKVRGEESVANLLQYSYSKLVQHSYQELESIRDGHLSAYNESLKK